MKSVSRHLFNKHLTSKYDTSIDMSRSWNKPTLLNYDFTLDPHLAGYVACASLEDNHSMLPARQCLIVVCDYHMN